MKKILQIFTCLMLLGFIGCNSNSNTESKEAAKGDSKPVIRVGLNAEYPPFEYKEGENIVGFDVDLLKAISEKAGFEYKLVHMSFDGLIPALKAGKIDMIMSGMSATPARMKEVDFSTPYYEGQTLYIKQKSNENIVDKESMKGKRVGVYIGTVQEQAIKKMEKDYDLKITSSDNIFTAIMNLKNNKVDVVAADHATAKGYLRENEELIGFYQEGDGSEGLSIAFDKGKYGDLLQKINETLNELRENGEYDKILEKYDLK